MLSSSERRRVRRVGAAIVSAFVLGFALGVQLWSRSLVTVVVAFAIGAVCGFMYTVWVATEARRMGTPL